MFQGILREVRGATPSYSLAVIKNGELIFKDCHPDFLIYDCASITKPLLTFPIVEVNVDLNADVRDFIPQIQYPLKIRDLIAHTSGLIPWLPLYLFKDSYIETILKKGFKGERGKKVYSCLNYILLKEVVERVCDKDFKSIVKVFLQRFKGCYLPPLKCVNVAPTEKGNVYEYKIAKMFVKDPDKRKFRFNRFIKGETHDLNSHYSNGLAGNSGLFANISGVVKLTQQLLKSDNWTLPLFEKDDYYYHLGFTGTGIAIHKRKDIFIVFLSNRICPIVKDIDFSLLRHRLFEAFFREFL